MTASLATRYLGLDLPHPLVASAGPLSSKLDSLRRLVDAGAAAIVLPSLFEEEIRADAEIMDRLHQAHTVDLSGEARGFLPPLHHDGGPTDRYLDLLQSATQLGVPIIASLNGVTPGGWVEYATELERAGAAALELNVYLVASDPTDTGASVEMDLVSTVGLVCGTVGIPVAVKLSPFFSAVGHMARRVVEAGAAGVVLFNRFYQPDIDLATLSVAPTISLSTSADLRLPLRWTGILHGQLAGNIALSGGVHTPADALKGLLAGADVVMTTSSLLVHGPGHLRTLREGVQTWLDANEYESVAQMRGSMSQQHVPDPDAYERANYLEVLRRASRRFG
jgi:dihydroorotate dehydrogenase (fumarate)